MPLYCLTALTFRISIGSNCHHYNLTKYQTNSLFFLEASNLVVCSSLFNIADLQTLLRICHRIQCFLFSILVSRWKHDRVIDIS